MLSASPFARARDYLLSPAVREYRILLDQPTRFRIVRAVFSAAPMTRKLYVLKKLIEHDIDIFDGLQTR